MNGLNASSSIGVEVFKATQTKEAARYFGKKYNDPAFIAARDDCYREFSNSVWNTLIDSGAAIRAMIDYGSKHLQKNKNFCMAGCSVDKRIDAFGSIISNFIVVMDTGGYIANLHKSILLFLMVAHAAAFEDLELYPGLLLFNKNSSLV